MKLNKLIRLAKSLHPCVFEDELIVHWISELDAQIYTEVHLLSPLDAVSYELTEDGAIPDTELAVPFPFDSLYVQYLLAQFSYYEGEYEKYQNALQMFNERYTQYVKWVCENINPGAQRAELEGYYLSAYAIAVKHGYEGSEQEWLSSLVGAPGERGPQGEPGPPGKMDETVLKLKDAINGMWAVMETEKAELPIVALYGDMGDERVLVRGVAEPLRKEDAANKAYVDKVAGAIDGQGTGFIDVTEGYAAGNEPDTVNYLLQLSEGKYFLLDGEWEYYCEVVRAGTSDIYHSIKIYSDESTLYQMFFINGSTVFSAEIGNWGIKIHNIQAPTSDSDAANKKYVDELFAEVEKGADGVGIASVEQTAASAEDGGSNVVTVTLSDGSAYTFTVRNGSKGAQGEQGIQGEKGDKGDQGEAGATGAAGKDGTSVTVASVTESSADGGANVITFSDGKTVTIKNGSKGSQGAQGEKGEKGDTGADGASVSVASVSQSTADGGSNVVTFSDGTTLTVKNGSKGSAGATGAAGKTPVKGVDYFTDTDKAEMVEAVQGAMDGILPDYWTEYITTKVNAINALHMSGGKDCFSFPLLTDIHIRQNLGKYSGILAKRILDGCYLPYAICTGDVVNRGSAGEAEMNTDFETVEALLAPIRDRLLQTQGNHDGSWGYLDYDGDGEKDYYAYNFTPEKLHALIYRKVGLVGECHFDASGTGYYIDDVSNKVRYIILNTHNNPYEEDENGFAVYTNMSKFKLQQSQFDMVIEALSTMPGEEWCALTASHVPLNHLSNASNANSTYANLVLMAKMLHAYRTKTAFTGSYAGQYGYDAVSVDVDFTSAKGEFIAHFAGHAHIDSVAVFNGISVFTTRCDGNNEPSDSGLTKTAGTVTEQSFDVFTVNRKDKRIYVTKIGAGDNRYWDYENGKEFDPGEAPVITYGITATLNNCTGASGNATTIDTGSTVTLTFTANDGYDLPESVTVSGAEYTWTQSTGALVLSNPTSNVSVTVSATETAAAYTNVLPLAQEYASSSAYVGSDGSVGYANDMRISTSSPTATYMKAQTGVDTTGLIPVKRGDVIRFRNCNLKVTPSNTSYGTMFYGFDSSKALVSGCSATYSTLPNRLPCVVDGDEYVQITLEPKDAWTTHNIDSMAYIMISTDGLDETSVITINEEITE